MAAERAVTLILTNSHDVTTDLLITRIGAERIFRFNFDLWPDYRILLTPAGFEIGNAAGRTVSDREIAKLLWRKPMRARDLTPDAELTDRQNYIEEELWYMMREIVNLSWSRGRLVLVEPFADARCGKLLQASVAQRYLTVPPFRSVFGASPTMRPGRRAVVKSLSSTRLGKNQIFYTTAVDEAELDPAIPWTIQDLVEAGRDVTIAFVRGELFAFELPRQPFAAQTLDWRELATQYVTDAWAVHRLPGEIARGAIALMADLRLDYGRIDMLLTDDGQYNFLEVNPNGEWGWLDASGTHGLLARIVTEISPDTPLHPLTMPRPPEA